MTDNDDDEAALAAFGRLAAAGTPMRRRGRGRVSGAHHEDPLTAGDVVDDFIEMRGWAEDLQTAGVIARWPQIVGENNAEHCHADSFSEGTLIVVTDSTAWATQLRLLIPQLIAKISREIGPDIVSEIVVRAPGRTSWKKGRLSVPGRGPRDTYG